MSPFSFSLKANNPRMRSLGKGRIKKEELRRQKNYGMRIDSPFPKGSPVFDRLHGLPGGFPPRRVAERSGALELSGLFSQLRKVRGVICE
jgi:hypothetical protein